MQALQRGITQNCPKPVMSFILFCPFLGHPLAMVPARKIQERFFRVGPGVFFA